MNLYYTSDQSRNFALQQVTGTMKKQMARLTQELSSGKVDDLPQHVHGNTQQVRYYEDRLAALSQYRLAASEMGLIAESAQTVLSAVEGEAGRLGLALYADSPVGALTMPDFMAHEAYEALEAAVSRLNTEVAGSYLFAGTNVDTPPLKPADEIMSHLSGLVAAITSAATIETFVSNWFDAPPGGGGFVDFAYQGSTAGSQIAIISEGEVSEFALTAISPTLRNVLKGYAMAATVDRGALAGLATEKQVLLRAAGSALFQNQDELINERGRLGLLQQRIDQAITENNSEKATLEISHSELTSADKFDTATALSEAQSQMETIYTLTARLSNMKLVNYLK